MQNLIRKIESRLESLPVRLAIELPGGRRAGAAQPDVRLIFQRWSGVGGLASGRIGGLAEAIVEGAVTLEGRMRDVMLAAAGLLPGNPTESNTRWWTGMLRRARSLASHTLERDAEQIQFHYDVSDAFYALWLDPRRVYSCAYYRTPELTLAQAQEAKLDLICRKLRLGAGERFLDIGAGWGGLLLWAAEHYGVDATGITLSKNQHAHVNRLIAEKGLAGRVRMELRDYREVRTDAPFDKIASVGMFEHVGRANMVTYFETVRRLLRPGGLVMNHGITAGGVHNDRLAGGMGDFIGKYIFPGGELLHAGRVVSDMAEAGLEMVDAENLRPHYARTLWAWSDALEARLDEALAVLSRSADGTEQAEQAERAGRTLRAYRLYLAGSAMSFERGWIALHQFLATHPDNNLQTGAMRGAQSAYPFNRDYIYRG